MADKKVDNLDIDNLDLELVKENTWDDLKTVFTDTLNSISDQIGLVKILKEQAKDRLTDETEKSFDGILNSFQDLMIETFKACEQHAGETKEQDINGKIIKIPVSLYTGKIEDNDGAITYLNIASKYLNIQDKLSHLMATGWVDLFVELKLSTEELEENISKANDALEKIVEETTKGATDGKQ